MTRYHNINGQSVQFTAQEETDRDAEEAAWAAGANDRQASELRKERDALLAACDWLRDVPSQLPGAVTWPTEPS